MTILPDGSGQVTGIIAEKWFALLLMEAGISFKWCGAERTVKPSANYDAHVGIDQKDYDCRIYVFASLTDEIVSFMGWCGKQEFWNSADIVSKGEKDSQGFVERTGAGKIKYNQLRPMLNFLEFAKNSEPDLCQ